MPEVTVKYKDANSPEALHNLAKMFDMVIGGKPVVAVTIETNHHSDIPITFATNPDVKALAGIWQDRDVSLADLRKEAWGDRF